MYNKSKNIPAEIGDVDSLFYDIDKNVDFVLVDRLYENYKQQMKAQEENSESNKLKTEEEKKEEALDDIVMLEENELIIAASNKRGKTLEPPKLDMDIEDEELNFDDIDIEDLPTLDMLSLKK